MSIELLDRNHNFLTAIDQLKAHDVSSNTVELLRFIFSLKKILI